MNPQHNNKSTMNKPANGTPNKSNKSSKNNNNRSQSNSRSQNNNNNKNKTPRRKDRTPGKQRSNEQHRKPYPSTPGGAPQHPGTPVNYALSAFQNSPDPKTLPIPTFVQQMIDSPVPISFEEEIPQAARSAAASVKQQQEQLQSILMNPENRITATPAPAKPTQHDVQASQESVDAMTLHLKQVLGVGGGTPSS